MLQKYHNINLRLNFSVCGKFPNKKNWLCSKNSSTFSSTTKIYKILPEYYKIWKTKVNKYKNEKLTKFKKY